jgi:hypothetical protein
VDVFLRRLPAKEEGEEQGKAIMADGVREHPSLRWSSRWVHPYRVDQIQQGVAQVVVLFEEQCRCPLPIFSGRLIEEVPPEWGYDPINKDPKEW